MEPDSCDEDVSVESDLATTVRYLDLWLRQKTDLFLQHYVFEPFDLLGTRMMYLVVVLTLLATAALIMVVGVIFLIATYIPLWAALLLSGLLALLAALIIVQVFLKKPIVLQTPTAREMMNRGKP
ncbi:MULTISPECIES: hypothetical protein [unclassified Methanoregula]|uniref:hypothetical protein n=1 Tax=unclassified Methanoregula TaxID=2649730 RepID=UPI0009C73146|nr:MULTISPECIES: hypothetical protein [unclassified Methanoregula]OPX65286.1 MAG: hypothetical protein A4E33_00319 [Methanoregula sp. PtaB.Bin085]OPY32195.1 MAG: hypothetical protein A4E34_02569 [Methanoregula sp. PtaU1.Bin006]